MFYKGIIMTEDVSLLLLGSIYALQVQSKYNWGAYKTPHL